MTKANKKVMESYVRSNAYSLSDVYKTFSQKKRQAFHHCRTMMMMYEGRELRVISHNTNFFSCAFLYSVNQVAHLMVITPSRDYSFAVEE